MKFTFDFNGMSYTNRTCSDDTTVSVKPMSISVEYTEKETTAAYDAVVKAAEVIASAMTSMKTSSEVADLKKDVSSWLNKDEIEDDIF